MSCHEGGHFQAIVVLHFSHSKQEAKRLRQMVYFWNLNEGLYVLVSIECCDKFISAFVKAYMYEGFKLQNGKWDQFRMVLTREQTRHIMAPPIIFISPFLNDSLWRVDLEVSMIPHEKYTQTLLQGSNFRIVYFKFIWKYFLNIQ